MALIDAALPSIDQLAAAMRAQLGLSAADADRAAALAVAVATATHDFVDQLRAAVLEAEGPAMDRTVERRFYAMGLRVAASLYSLPEGADPDSQAVLDPMPVFTIQGTDQLAPDAVAAYQNLCVQAGLSDQANQVWLALGEIARWQSRHPDLVKLPDHKHVPVTDR